MHLIEWNLRIEMLTHNFRNVMNDGINYHFFFYRNMDDIFRYLYCSIILDMYYVLSGFKILCRPISFHFQTGHVFSEEQIFQFVKVFKLSFRIISKVRFYNTKKKRKKNFRFPFLLSFIEL